ncbi:hypothetical protein C0993_006272 [Termitomyces sp. T159_Od127]|nr:hypothetical protein C0993_006272 [Termitomyces sp. T159_Od127]
MLKKVKARQYKSKREFKDDLDLIWSNCFTYNASENHPLRPCVKRLQLKADRLLKYITDRKDRADPPIPSDITATHIARPKINGNGVLNGRLHGHQRSPSISTFSKSSTPTIKASPSLSAKPLRRDAPFPDTPAITRTPAGMTLFMNIDRVVSTPDAGSTSEDTPSVLEKLQELAGLIELPPSPNSRSPTPENVMDIDAGDKRKLNGFTDHRPRKRTRFSSQYAMPLAFDKNDASELWWNAVQSDSLLANGLPQIPLPSSCSSSSSATVATRGPSSSNTSLGTPHKPKTKRRKKRPVESPSPKSLLTLMNNNIKTMKRLRHTHAKFAALNANNPSNGEDTEGGGDGAPYSASGPALPVMVGGDDEGIEAVDDKVDERPWRATIKGKRKVRGIEIGEEAAMDCMKWMGRKVLEHAGFQGTSQVTLDVLSGVASEFMLNVGRTIRFLSDKYGATMTPEEIILHTLFESGISKVQELERYVSDDVERYGARLAGLEEKLVTAYRESTTGEVLEDEGLFEEEEEEEAGVLAIGDFADALGEDYLGLRELGIAAEFGLSNLSIPKKLLRRKKLQKPSAAAKPTEPPPPYPPPPPFLPLTVAKVEDQIGLLKPYYQARFNQLALSLLPPPVPTTLPGPPALPGPPTSKPQPSVPAPPSYGQTPYPPANPTPEPLVPPPVPTSIPPSVPPEKLVLPDDPPNSVNAKMGPLGQIVRGGPSGAASKKKKAGGAGSGGMGTEVGTPTPKKKKTGMVGVGTGNGRKKKGEESVTPAPVPGASVPMQFQGPQSQAGAQLQSSAVSIPMSYLGPPPVAAYTMPLHMQLQPPVMGQ